MNTRFSSTWGQAPDPNHPWRPNRLLALREHAGVSKSQLSRELGVNESSIGKWETWTRPGPENTRKLDAYAERVGFETGGES